MGSLSLSLFAVYVYHRYNNKQLITLHNSAIWGETDGANLGDDSPLTRCTVASF